MATTKKALLIDITKCIGCQQCAGACKEAHGTPGDPEPKLSETALTVVQDKDGKYVRKQCLHCEKPACASACLVGALRKTDYGPVVYDKNKCVGCRYCMIACPHSIPRYEWSKLAPYMKKCDMCFEKRVSQGQPTACAEACPVGATIFGDRDQILREARKRIFEDPKYVPHIYGEREYGGASMLFLSDVEFEKLGFVIPTKDDPLPEVSKAALDEAPMVVLVGGTMLAGLYWITNRRKEVLLAEAQKKTLKFPFTGDEEKRS
jgi:formate dehydrogenase iron-sulfur subunit